MTNALYGKGREKFASGGINWGTGSGGDAIHVDLIDLADYTLSITANEFHSTTTVPTVARVATFGPLVNKTLALGVLDGDDVTLPTVTGDQSEALILWKNTGSDATSPLLIYIDSATGLPVTPNGGNIGIQWPVGGIATL